MDRLYELQGRAHSALTRLGKEQRGQGTVEYVGVVLLIAMIVGGVLKTGIFKDPQIAKAVIKQIQNAIAGIKL